MKIQSDVYVIILLTVILGIGIILLSKKIDKADPLAEPKGIILPVILGVQMVHRSVTDNVGEKTADPLEMYMSDLFTVPVNISGMPAVSLPGGVDASGMPIGLQLIGPALSEERILKAAYVLEKAVSFCASNKPALD